MKRNLLKILSLFTMLFVTIFAITTKASAASTHYAIAANFTFSSDMDVDEGFDLIKPFILYYDDAPSTNSYTFNYEQVKDTQYRFSGTYPDGNSYSIYASIRINENASGTYVEALRIEPYRQSIYIKNLNEGKTTNDCLMECFKSRFVCIKYPTYNIQDTPTMNIYTHMTTLENAAGTHHMQYYAVIENVNFTPDDDYQDNATNNNTTPGGSTTNPDTPDVDNPTDDPSLDEPIIPDDGESGSNQTPSTDNNDNQNNNQNGSNNNPSDSNNDNSTDENNSKDPLLIALFCAAGLIGFVLIFLLYKVIKHLVLWLKR